MPYPHEKFGRGLVPDDPKKLAEVSLIISKEMHEKGKSFIKAQNPAITDAQIDGATIIAAPSYPSSFSLAMPPMGNQLTEGSCVSFGCEYYGLSRAYLNATGAATYNTKVNIFSPEYVYDQTKVGTCADGSSMTTNLDFLVNNGDVLWNTVPYTDISCDITPTQAQIQEAAGYKITGYKQILSSDTSALKSLLLAGHALPVAYQVDYNYVYGRTYDKSLGKNQNMTVAVNNNYVWSSYSPLIYGGHCNCLVGWDDSRSAWLVINQWGANWGDAGYRWIAYSFITTATNTFFDITGFRTIVPATPESTNLFVKKTPTGKTLLWNVVLNNSPISAAIEISTDNVVFNTLHTISPFSSIGMFSYQTATTDRRYFRLKIVKSDSTTIYSETIVVPSIPESYNLFVVKTSTGKTVLWDIALNNPPMSAVVEISTDNVTFNTLHTIAPFVPLGSFTYQTTTSATRYFRLKIVKSDSTTVYTSVFSL